MYKPKVYTASKIRYKQEWLGTAMRWPSIEFTARWIQQPDAPDLSDTEHWSESERRRLWIQNVQDVQRSDYVVAYMQPGDEPRGTIFEIGGAVMLGKVVYQVGFDDRHSWKWHPLVHPFDSVFLALEAIIGASS